MAACLRAYLLDPQADLLLRKRPVMRRMDIYNLKRELARCQAEAAAQRELDRCQANVAALAAAQRELARCQAEVAALAAARRLDLDGGHNAAGGRRDITGPPHSLPPPNTDTALPLCLQGEFELSERSSERGGSAFFSASSGPVVAVAAARPARYARWRAVASWGLAVLSDTTPPHRHDPAAPRSRSRLRASSRLAWRRARAFSLIRSAFWR